jgi:hypothetical protein
MEHGVDRGEKESRGQVMLIEQPEYSGKPYLRAVFSLAQSYRGGIPLNEVRSFAIDVEGETDCDLGPAREIST